MYIWRLLFHCVDLHSVDATNVWSVHCMQIKCRVRKSTIIWYDTVCGMWDRCAVLLGGFSAAVDFKLASHDAKKTKWPELIMIIPCCWVHLSSRSTSAIQAHYAGMQVWDLQDSVVKMLFIVFDEHLACLRQQRNSCKDVISCLPTNLCSSLHMHSKHPYS